MLDAALLSVFIEWWHEETSFFHLSFGEMKITLDDVSSLLHLPLPGSFFIAPLIYYELVRINVIHDLGIS